MEPVVARTMTLATTLEAAEPIYFDFALLRKTFLYFALILLVFAPFSRDPLVVVACGFMPLVLIALVDCPRMPAAVVYYLLFVWSQGAARLLVAGFDGEALGDGPYGNDVYRAFWYSMASLFVLATTFRLSIGGLPQLSNDQLTEHQRWRLSTLLYLYVATALLAFAVAPIAALAPGLNQPLTALGSLKFVVIFMLFARVLSTGNGMNLLLMVLLIEVVTGFTGLFSGFKTVFVLLLIVALSLRIPLRMTNLLGGVVTVLVLFGLGVFWTAVKSEYRDVATGRSGDSQTVTAAFTERIWVLVDKAIHPGTIEWGLATEQLFRRIAYIDFFGASIGVSETAPEPGVMVRWTDALEHVSKPRFLFPDKAALDDTQIFLRYVRGELTEEARSGTSISIGFLAENFIDFGFPGMLVPIAALGFSLGLAIRYFMTRPVSGVMSEAVITGLVVTVGAGMELSLAKFLGSAILVSLVLGFCLRLFNPYIERWLKG